MICRHCRTDIADNALICYRCGHATAEPRVKAPAAGPIFTGRRRWRMTPLLIAAGVLAMVLIWLLAG